MPRDDTLVPDSTRDVNAYAVEALETGENVNKLAGSVAVGSLRNLDKQIDAGGHLERDGDSVPNEQATA